MQDSSTLSDKSFSPLISIIMPVYNCEKYVGEAIDSIISQTYTNWELLICDDGSKDESWNIIKEFKDRDIRIYITKNFKNLGKVVSVNQLFKICKGSYISVHDADDWSSPTRFFKQIEFLENNKKFAMCGSDFIEHTQKKHRLVRMPIDYLSIRKQLPEISQFHGPTLVVRKEVIKNIGGLYRNFTWGEDIDLAARVVEKYPATNLSLPLYHYRVHSKSLTNSSDFLDESRFISRELRVFLANQRIERGWDCLMKSDIYEFEREKKRLIETLNISRSSVCWEFSQRLYTKGFKFQALKASIKALWFNPSIKNIKNLFFMTFGYFAK